MRQIQDICNPMAKINQSLGEFIIENQSEFNGSAPLKSRSSETPKRSTWRCDFADGSKFSSTVEENGEKSKLILSHTAVPTKQEADDWKDFWRNTAEQLIKQ